MNINSFSPVGSGSRSALADAFQAAAREGEAVRVVVDGQQFRVLGAGATPSDRHVAWIQPDQTDSNSVFVEALGQAFSNGIATAVAREFDLLSATGKPLASRTVTHALEMAHTSRQAMDGVDFMTRLNFSAVNSAPAFEAAMHACGVDALNPGERHAIDVDMQLRFQTAAAEGASPVMPSTAQAWLEELLHAIVGKNR